MSATSEYEPPVRQDYGPTTSSENIYEHVLEHKLIDTMDISNVRTPVLRAVTISPTQDTEPDSTNPESIIQSIHKDKKDIEYHLNDKRCDTEMSIDSLPRIVSIEETTYDNVGRIAYHSIQETDDVDNGNYVENATLIPTPLNAAIVQNVTKLPPNFTINVDATVGNITAIQNVSQEVTGNQTLWLPTILATSAADNKSEEDRPPGVSQIIITSENYANDISHAARRTNIISETNYINRPKTSKVQILSNISLPKNSNYSQQYIAQGKEVSTPVYGTQNHVYKLNTNVVSQKHLNSTMLSTKPPKPQSLIGASLSPSVINNSSIKNVPYGHTYSKSTNLNKVNNGANVNAVVAPSSGNTQCHILSRVVSGPNKISVHSGRKSVNTFKGSKNSVSSQKNQSRSIKIIQQTGTAHKSENKPWPVGNVTYKSQGTSFGVIEANTSKVIQKVGSPTHKNQQTMTLQKVPKGERLVLQSPCGPVLLSTAPLSTSLPKGPHYVQSGATPNLRYVQTYDPDNQLSTVSQVSANQQLTAQILQSLSQPKLILQQSPTHIHPVKNQLIQTPIIEEPVETKPVNQKRIVFGDKSTLLTADDIIGMEERPNLSEELRRYSYQPLAFVMLDHTYALPAQKQPIVSTPTTAVASISPIISTPTTTTAPMSPLKTSPVTAVSHESPPAPTPTSTIVAPIAATTTQMSLTYKQQPSSQDDDTASVISSIEGERRPPAPGGSDTETAPEGEEEGKTRCICDFTHDDGYMICCDRCGEWQHVDCMGIDRNNIPDAYMCELCQPRTVDRRHARAIQLRKREELNALAASDSDSSECSRPPGTRRKRLVTVTTYTNTSGSCVTTYNSNLPALPPLPQPTVAVPLPKRGPKRPKKSEVVRKCTKRKLTEKRVKRKKEMLLNRSKYNSTVQSSQSHWRDLYELAMTNHYSPELRAKIMKYSNKLGSTPTMASAITAHLCTTVPHAGGKILIATKDLKENTPVIELRGKYMLSNQHRPQLQNTARAGSQKPGPFVFFYRLPKDNTQICIDTRTYGNEARFVRRSCKPNAELQHCIVKGALHVYLVSITDIPSNTEITVGHDTNGSKQPCACGNPKHCKVNGLNVMVPRKSLDYPQREKRNRNRCFSSSSPVSPPLAPILTTPVKDIPAPFSPKCEKKSPIKYEFSPMSPVKEPILSLDYNPAPLKFDPFQDFKNDNQEFDLTAKEEMKSDLDEPDFIKIEPKLEEPISETEEKEEPKPEILPAVIDPPEPEPIKEEGLETKELFLPPPLPPVVPEELEPAEPEPDSEPEPEPEPKPEPEPEFEPEPERLPEPDPEPELKEEEEKPIDPKTEPERPVTRELTAKSACHDRSSRSSRTTCINQDSLDDKTDDSQDKIQIKAKEKDKRKMTREERKMEAIMKAFERMEKAQQRKQEVKERQKRRESDPHPNTEKEDDDEMNYLSKKRKKRRGRARTASQSNRRRLNSADSDLVTSGDEAQPMSPRASSRQEQPLPTPEVERLHEPVNEDLGLSPACLLVEAAVGSVESAFKLPKTKKTMATEWVGRSPERTPSPYTSPYRPALVSAPSLESLVRVASTIIGDLSGTPDYHDDEQHSPPRTPGRDRNRPPKKARRVTRSTPAEVAEVLPVQHSAKKRWLRQAISEEIDLPIVESPPNEIITPLKKRRMARESLSCEQNNIVPCNDETSPLLTSEDSPVKEDALSLARQYKRNIMDMYSRDRTRSDSGQGSDDQCNIDHDVLNVNIKGPHDSEHIRRIIGVPTPEEEIPPEIAKLEDISMNNNNLELEESIYNKVVPMEIDTTVITQSKIESNEMINEMMKGTESPNDKVNSSQSADTSGNSSPQRDEMDDIQKKIHSFHTENIMILKSRNKKPPKEKRKKVNLNFDLNMVDDQISIQLRTEDDSSPKSPEINGDGHDDANDDDKLLVSPENIPLPPVELIPLPAPENIPLPPVELIPLPAKKNIPLPPVELIPLPVPENIPLPPVELIPLPAKKNIPLPPVKLIPLPAPENIPLPPVKLNSLPAPENIPLPPVKLIPLPALENIPLPPVKLIPLPAPENIPLPPVKLNSLPAPENIPLPPVELIPLPAPENIPLPPVELIPLPAPENIPLPPVKLIPVPAPENIPLPPVKLIPLPTPENIPLSPVKLNSLPAPENIPLPEDPIPIPIIHFPEAIPLPEEPMKPSTPVEVVLVPEKAEREDNEPAERPSVLENTLPFSTRFSSTGLFSGIFSNISQTFKVDSSINENIPNMSLIKSAIDRTTSLDNSLFEKDSASPVDELKSVQEILTRVNNMDSNNSVLLSGVLRGAGSSGGVGGPLGGGGGPLTRYGARANDPRLHPPPQDKPKPVRRKLSISEYRKRHRCGEEWAGGEAAEEGEGSRSSASLSPQRLDAAAAAAADDLEQRLHRDLATSAPKGMFDAQPTASERQRENIGSRLRREFGLALPDEDDAHADTEVSKRCDR